MGPLLAFRLLAALVLLAAAGAVVAAGQEPPDETRPETFSESIEVSLSTLRVRAVESDGTPLRGLGPEDFRVRVGRREVRVVAADWISSAEPLGWDTPPEALEEAGFEADPPGQLVVFFVQPDWHFNRSRGLLRMLPRAVEIADFLAPEDRVAVVSFDTHLKLWRDFARDEASLEEALLAAIRRERPPEEIRGEAYPSLGSHFDFDAALDAARPETAMRLTAEAMEPLHGEKVVIYMGWGMGNLTGVGVTMPLEYRDTLAALERARASVFVLDVSDADFHSLEVGLKKVAGDTGGEYFKTHQYPLQVTHRLARSLGGFYLLSFEKPRLSRAAAVDVALRSLPGKVLAPRLELRP